jgi:FMN phosphatase YigB (HAD superfamily)
MTIGKKTNIIWDLSGTLLRPSPVQLSKQELKDYSLVFYLWSGKSEATLVDQLALKVLHTLGEQSGPEEEIIRVHTGEPAPEIICSYVGGLITSQQAWQQIQPAFESWKSTHAENAEYFSQIERVMKAFFTPEVLARCMEPIAESNELLREIAYHQQKTGRGSLYILSNWDSESFDLIYEKFRTSVFSHFKREHIVISGDAKALKPDPQIYRYFLSKYHLNPSSCFFIDDQPENLIAANHFGIAGARFQSQTVQELRAKLLDLGIL